MIKITSILVQILLFLSCSQGEKVNKNEIDSFIEKYNLTDFSEFKDSFVAIRQKNRNEVTYLVQKSEGNLPVYFVTYNLYKQDITEINRELLQEMDVADYYTDSQIKHLIDIFRKYDFALLHVDRNNNVFINPNKINSPPTLLRLNVKTNEEFIKKGYVYILYKENWYLRK
ncbi:hypothetical protein [Moheibacter sp.]|uniref:hypothetical protein n=1 Tax=Moheibacter sp. TaxID=1965316 RepID=UPI003C77C7DD